MNKPEPTARILNSEEERTAVSDLSESVMVARLEDWISRQ